ncbi:fimbrial protein [Pseudomonas cavernicola]|uniref:Fimbrial protein n=1 Tax=Pseudomonas cavernicola TaxID=2320866 RepID=A0A418XJY8_9PSED|nr:fimbrial protein [Pseudomonas cavernicola]RJG12798.1 fimbrial protein [Pseudomonas cavernicola]
MTNISGKGFKKLGLLAGLALVGGILATPASATCYQVSGTSTSPGNNQILPTEGAAYGWAGAGNGYNGSLGLPSVINVSDEGFQPNGTLLAAGTAPFTQYGFKTPYGPEQTFFRCAPADAGSLYEKYAIHGNYRDVAMNEDGALYGIPSGFATKWANVAFRMTNLSTGQYFKRNWQQRPLTGLDVDSRGYLLVKAKNFTSVYTELYRIGPGAAYNLQTGTGLYNDIYPLAYIAFAGPGVSSPPLGSDSNGNDQGYGSEWPGTLSLYNYVTLRRSATCAVNTVTPVVQFPLITVAELMAGGNRQVPFQVSFKCQSAAVSGVAQTNTALGLLPSAGSRAAASSLGLTNASGGSAYLLSDQYGSAGIAQGVGIRILRNNQAINLLPNENSAMGATATATAMGWYPVLGGAQVKTGSSGGVDQYTETFNASLEKLTLGTRPPVTAGSVNATAQVIIRVQ